MEPETVGAIIEAVGRHWRSVPGLEVTLEANPTSIEAGKFRRLRDAGVNRISIGVQALDDQALSFLGPAQRRPGDPRIGDRAADVRSDVLRSHLCTAEQTLEEWERELAAALDLAGGHISLYQLTIEDRHRLEQTLRPRRFPIAG